MKFFTFILAALFSSNLHARAFTAPGYFNPNLPPYYSYRHSYAVGSSFILFLESLGDQEQLRELLINLGEQKELGSSAQKIYNLELAELERLWKSFVEKANDQ